MNEIIQNFIFSVFSSFGITLPDCLERIDFIQLFILIFGLFAFVTFLNSFRFGKSSIYNEVMKHE